MKPFDLGIRCDYLLTMQNGSTDVLRDYFVGIQDTRIAAVVPWTSRPSGDCGRLIHAENKVLLPGLINAHTHLAMSLLRGLADDLPFTEWLHQHILPVESKLVNSEFVRVGTGLAALECIRGGVTTVCDMYYFSDTTASVLEDAGLRGLVSQAIASFPTPDNKDLKGNDYRTLDRMRERFGRHERIIPCVGPHAPYTCDDETLAKARSYAGKHGLPIVIHVSETSGEVQESRQKYGKTPVARMKNLGLTGPDAVFAHCVHVDDDDIRILAETKTAAIYNPESNMKLSSGVAPIPRLLGAGVVVGLGTDGAASNNDLSVFREMDTAAKLQKLTQHDNTAMTASQSLRMATIDGARALGIEDRVGSVETGKFADLILVDLVHPHMQPVHNVVSQLVYSASGLEVDTVICHGKILMESARIETITTLDASKIYAEASALRDAIGAAQ